MNTTFLLVLALYSGAVFAFSRTSGQMNWAPPTGGTFATGSAFGDGGNISAQSITYVTPGEILFSAERYCGDGDVAHYAGENPHVDFIPNDQGQVALTLGFWLKKKGESGQFPLLEQWYPIGLQNLNIFDYRNVDDSGKNIYVINKSASQKYKPMKVVLGTLQYLTEQAKKINSLLGDSMNSEKYYLYMAAMICKEFGGKGNIKDNPSLSSKPFSLEIAQSFLFQIRNDIETSAASLQVKSDLDDLSRYRFVYNSAMDIMATYPNVETAGPLSLVVSKSSTGPGTTSLTNELGYVVAKEILNLELSPEHKASAAKTYLNKFSSLVNEGDCHALRDKLKSHVSGGTLSDSNAWWDPFKAPLGCDYLLEAFKDGGPFEKLQDALNSKQEGPFEESKVILAQSFFKYGIMTNALSNAPEMIFGTKERSDNLNCFHPISGSSYLNRVVGSYVMSLTELNDAEGDRYIKIKEALPMIHPEGDFAINTFRNYTDNNFVIFGMVGDPASLLLNDSYLRRVEFGLGENGFVPKISLLTGVDGVWMNFHIRSIGCSVNWYCQAGRKFRSPLRPEYF